METNELQLSIIIPFYNGGNYLERCFNSLLNQGLDPELHEIIFINDGSTDDSLDLLAPYLKKYGYVKLFSQSNRGAGAARNHGMEKARGKYLYFLDVDDYLAKESLGFLLNFAIKNELDILGFDTLLTIRTDDFDPVEINRDDDSVKIMDGITYLAKNKIRQEPWWYLVNRNFLETHNITFFEDHWMEDAYFIICILLAAKRVAKAPIAAHRYVQTSDSAMRTTDASHALKVMDDIVFFCNKVTAVLKDLEDVDHEHIQVCKKRIRVQQEACVYFGIIRAYRAQVPFEKMKAILLRLRTDKAYPLKNFISDEFNEPIQKMTVFIFNRPLLLQSFWCTYPLKKKFLK